MPRHPSRKPVPLAVRLLRSLGVLAVLMLVMGLVVTQPSCAHYPPTSQRLDSDRLRAHVETLAVDLAPRNFQEFLNLEASAQYIADHFEKAGGRVSAQLFQTNGESYQAQGVKTRDYRNVIASFGPVDGERIIVGAHYDACGQTPGADDNASGVAGLIELAYLLGRTELRQRIDLVAFTLEEPPFFRTYDMGSARHAYSLRQEDVAVECMICLEMIGYFSDEKGSQQSPSLFLKLLYPDRANFIAVVGGFADRKLLREVKGSMQCATDLPVCGMCAPRGYAGIDLSDHRNYWARDYTAIMVTDTSFYRNRRYHHVQDTPDTLDYDRMAKVVLGVYEAVVRMANEG